MANPASTPAVASTGNDAADNVPAAEEVQPVETAMTEAEEKAEGDAVNPDSEIEESTNINGHAANESATTEATKEDQEDACSKLDDGGPSSAVAPTTPATGKKAATGSAKKKGGVPEHKSKKLNKKKSKPTLRLDVRPGELYLARMKGHPPWPSIVCDEEMLPESLTTTRPVTTALPDGSFKKPEYADGGKRAYERTFPIMFLRTNEFAWIPNTELTPLTPEECKDVPEKGKQKALKEAYEIASEDHDLAFFKTMLGEHAKAIQEDEELRAQKEAEKEAKKARQAKRKSTAATAEDDEADEMDVDDDGEPKPKASKKRKKSLESDGEEKPAKTPKTGIKLKISNPKTPTEPTSSKKAAKSKGARKSATKVEEEDEAEEAPTPEEKPLSPAEAKDKKEKEIKYYRHKLQKGFLSRDTPPDDEETKSMSSFLNKLENHQDLEGSIIRATKIHKVLKAMIRLSSIPLDETYKFKERCVALLALWNKTLSDDPSAAAEANEGAEGAEPKTNGVGEHAAENGEKASEKDVEVAAAPEVKESVLKGKIGTNVEGEKEAEEGAGDKDTAMDDAKDTDAPDVETKPEDAYVPPAEPVEASA